MRSWLRKADTLQSQTPSAFELPTPEFFYKRPPKFKTRKAPESWHRFCRQRAQWRRDLRDALNAANGPQLTNHQRMKMAQAKARRIKAGLAA